MTIVQPMLAPFVCMQKLRSECQCFKFGFKRLKMARDDQLKREQVIAAHNVVELARVGDSDYVRDPEGTWRYAESWIKVPGARDMTLTERFRPKFVIANTSDGAEVERVIVSGDDVAEHPDLLGWCLGAGAPLRNPETDELIEVLVPFSTWAERDRIPHEIVAPENSDNQAERAVALAERRYREAEHALDMAADFRAAVLREHSSEMTREQARAITGLSVGRIQQLIRSEIELDETDQMTLFLFGAEGIFRKKAKLVKAIDEVYGATFPTDLLDRCIDRLEHLELIEKVPKNGYRITRQGEEMLDTIAGRNAESDDLDLIEEPAQSELG
jgi:hypothetical protein